MLQFRPRESRISVIGVHRGYQTSFSKIVFRLQVLNFGGIGSVDNTDWDGEDRVALDSSEKIDLTSQVRHLHLHPP
jgi:hypothetical protein